MTASATFWVNSFSASAANVDGLAPSAVEHALQQYAAEVGEEEALQRDFRAIADNMAPGPKWAIIKRMPAWARHVLTAYWEGVDAAVDEYIDEAVTLRQKLWDEYVEHQDKIRMRVRCA